MSKQRLDTLLVDRGLAESREKAQALVMAGQVTIGDRLAIKPGVLVASDASLNVAHGPKYVGRGGEKLEHALSVFGLDVTGLVVADIGASTGGFTDCLLQNGASRVYAVDVGRGQLDYRLRRDNRVVSMEGVNARDLESLPEPIDLAVVDVSFISLRLVLPATAALLARPVSATHASLRQSAKGEIVVLFKPQFEAERHEVPRGGVIRDANLHSVLIGRFGAWCVGSGFRILGMTSSPIFGAEGNREFLFWLRPVR